MLDSGYAKNISDVGVSGVNDDGDDEDDDAGKSIGQDDEDDDRNKQTGFWGGKGEKDFGRAKQVILYPFLKAKKQLCRKNKKASSPPIINTAKTNSVDQRVGDGASVVDGSVNQGCSFCFTKLKISESKNGSQTSDPNDRTFTREMLKVLIEKNDFYSKESNPHLGVLSYQYHTLEVFVKQREHFYKSRYARLDVKKLTFCSLCHNQVVLVEINNLGLTKLPKLTCIPFGKVIIKVIVCSENDLGLMSMDSHALPSTEEYPTLGIVTDLRTLHST